MLQFFARRIKELHDEDRKGQKGFTLIELLVVIIIIGILAAIALPVFLAQRERAWNAAAQSELRNMAAAATSCSTENGGAYNAPDDCSDDAPGGILTQNGWSDDSNVAQNVTVATADVWTAQANHVNNAACVYTFTYDEAAANAGQVVPGAGC